MRTTSAPWRKLRAPRINRQKKPGYHAGRKGCSTWPRQCFACVFARSYTVTEPRHARNMHAARSCTYESSSLRPLFFSPFHRGSDCPRLVVCISHRACDTQSTPDIVAQAFAQTSMMWALILFLVCWAGIVQVFMGFQTQTSLAINATLEQEGAGARTQESSEGASGQTAHPNVVEPPPGSEPKTMNGKDGVEAEAQAPPLQVDSVPAAQTVGSSHALALYEPEGDLLDDILPDHTDTEISPINSLGTVIYRRSLSKLRDDASAQESIELLTCATPERYRFIDCASFVHSDMLQLWETSVLPEGQYAAISHVWKSLEPIEGQLTSRGIFLVACENQNDGGPISIDVVRYACLAALHANARLLWLDRLCILQTKSPEAKRDKRWQIMQMYNVYKGCSITIVLPAGLQRFPTKSEETEWMERAWTFQEVMVVPVVKVLYMEIMGSPPAQPVVRSMDIDKYFIQQQRWYDDNRDLSRERRLQFVQALSHREQFRGEATMPLARFHDIWQYVQWRTSSCPADVVFSVMGLLGVTLDPGRFDRNDRLSATIALAQELLLKDPSRNTSIDIPLWRRLSTANLAAARATSTTGQYLKALPKQLRLLDLEKELDEVRIHRFRSISTQSLIPEAEQVDKTDIDTSQWDGYVVMGNADPEELLQRFAIRQLDPSVKSRKRAGRIVTDIPAIFLQLASDPRTTERVFFRSSHDVVIELCRELLPDSRGSVDASGEKCVFGWSIQSVLGVGRGAREVADLSKGGARQTLIPIVTFWKFAVERKA